MQTESPDQKRSMVLDKRLDDSTLVDQVEFEDYEKETASSKQITSDARPTGYISEEEEDQD